MTDIQAGIGLSSGLFKKILARLRKTDRRRRGPPWSTSLRRRLLLVCLALRTNLTMRELAALLAVSKSHVHRVIADLTPRIAAFFHDAKAHERRSSWVLDGTLVPTRDHAAAAKSKNYRWSCNLQVLIRRRDLHVIELSGGGPGNRNDPIHYRGSSVERLSGWHGRVLADGGYRGVPELITPRFARNRIVRDDAWRRHRRRRARVEHAIARLKNWRVLRDYRRRGNTLLDTARAVAFLHNEKVETLRDST